MRSLFVQRRPPIRLHGLRGTPTSARIYPTGPGVSAACVPVDVILPTRLWVVVPIVMASSRSTSTMPSFGAVTVVKLLLRSLWSSCDRHGRCVHGLYP